MHAYAPVPSKENLSSDASVSDLEICEYDTGSSSPWTRHVGTRLWPWVLHLTVFALSLSAGFFVQPTQRCASSRDALLNSHPYDRTIRLNGTLNRDSPYKGPPSPEVDKAWDDILPMRAMIISEDIFQTINTSKYSVKTPAYLGTGRLAIFEAFHQLHCVRSLWKAAYPAYYTEEAELARTDPEEWARHVDHCADMLRQKFMCEADPSLITYNWLQNHYNPHPNFNVEHRCRNYDRLLEAVDRYGVDENAIPEGGIRRPTDTDVVEFVEPPFDPLASG